MKRKIRINIAWIVWNLLTALNYKIWRRYGNDFIDTIMADDADLLFFKARSQDVIPF